MVWVAHSWASSIQPWPNFCTEQCEMAVHLHRDYSLHVTNVLQSLAEACIECFYRTSAVVKTLIDSIIRLGCVVFREINAGEKYRIQCALKMIVQINDESCLQKLRSYYTKKGVRSRVNMIKQITSIWTFGWLQQHICVEVVSKWLVFLKIKGFQCRRNRTIRKRTENCTYIDKLWAQ